MEGGYFLIVLMPESMRRLLWARIIPYSEDNLCYVISKNFHLALINIRVPGTQETFSVKKIMEENSIFGNIDFDETVYSLAEILDTRLERFLVTKKADSMFFDEEEQKFLKELFRKKSLMCDVQMIVRDSVTKKPSVVNFDDLGRKDVLHLSKFLNHTKAHYMCHAVTHVGLLKSRTHYDRIRYLLSAKLEKCFSKSNGLLFHSFPELAECKSKQEYSSRSRAIIMKLHPDICRFDYAKEVRAETIKNLIELVKETQWFKSLPDMPSKEVPSD